MRILGICSNFPTYHIAVLATVIMLYITFLAPVPESLYLLTTFLQFPLSPPGLLTFIYGYPLHAYSNMSNEALDTTSMFYIEKNGSIRKEP